MCYLTRKKLISIGFDIYEANVMLNSLGRQCSCKTIQERNWFIQEGRESLAIRTVRAFDGKLALPHIDRMIEKATTNSRTRLSIWTNLKSAFEKVEKHESNS